MYKKVGKHPKPKVLILLRMTSYMGRKKVDGIEFCDKMKRNISSWFFFVIFRARYNISENYLWIKLGRTLKCIFNKHPYQVNFGFYKRNKTVHLLIKLYSKYNEENNLGISIFEI